MELFWNKVVEGLPILFYLFMWTIKKSIKKTKKIFCLFSSSLNLHKVMQCPFNIFLIPLCLLIKMIVCVRFLFHTGVVCL